MKTTLAMVFVSILCVLLLSGCNLGNRVFGTADNPLSEPVVKTDPAAILTFPPTESPTAVTDVLSTPTLPPAIEPTAVPSGIYALYLFYSPLVVSYDPALWTDHTVYSPTAPIADHYLQSAQLESCRISEYGPTDFINARTTSEQVALGQLHFTVMFPNGGEEETVYAFYIDDKSVAGFDYSMALPVLLATSSAEKWTECRAQAEEVLSTLHMP